jgi:hypothetical protein
MRVAMRAPGCLVLWLIAGCGGRPATPVGDGASDADDPWGRRRPPPTVFPGGLDAASPDAAPPPSDAAVPPPDAHAPDASPPDGRPPDGPAPDARPAADARPDVAVVLDGCQIVSCDGLATKHDCCRAWYYFALDSDERNQVQRDDLVKTFSKGADVRASYLFDGVGQNGAVGFLLDRARGVTAIRVASEWSGTAGDRPYVSTEAPNGTAGCAYPLGTAGQADLTRPLYCWGDRSFVPDRINVRTESRSTGPASIRITAVDVR